MQAAKAHARWTEAIPLTVTLWVFVLLLFLPAIIARHGSTDPQDILLDASTIFLSISLALGMFALFRASIGWMAPARLLMLGLCVAAIASFQTFFDLLFTHWVAANLQESWAAVPRNLSRAYGSLFNYIAVFSVNLALFQLAYQRHHSLAQERQLAAANSAAQQAQLEALRLQLNPHFLFNTLNAISAMIVTQRNDDAELMTERLCSFLRASLSFDPTELVPLDEELALVEDYLEIEQVRFGERLIVEIDCAPDARGIAVPGLLIQPLVENAIKYGVAPSRQPVTVRLAASVADSALTVVVEDNGAADRASARPAGTGVGQQNIRRRLTALYGGAASFDAQKAAPGYRATICLPVAEVPARAAPHEAESAFAPSEL